MAQLENKYVIFLEASNDKKAQAVSEGKEFGNTIRHTPSPRSWD